MINKKMEPKSPQTVDLKEYKRLEALVKRLYTTIATLDRKLRNQQTTIESLEYRIRVQESRKNVG